MARSNGEIQARIQTAAKILFSNNGYKETKIQDISKAANVSLGTIYTYYANKRTLFDSLDIPNNELIRPEFEKKREEVINKALVLFGKKGFEGTTMENIAASLGISKAALYLYCTSKKDLFSQVLQKSTLNIKTMNLRRSYDHMSWEQAILDIGLSYVQIGHDYVRTALLRSVLHDSYQFPEIGYLYYESGFKVAADNIIRFLKDVEAKNLIRNINMEIAVNSYLGSLLSYIILYNVISGVPKLFNEQEYVKQVTDLFINGLKQNNLNTTPK